MKNSVLIKIFAILCILCMSLAICACNTDHTHSYVDGKCECGEADPNYKPAHTHSYVDGKCECGEFDPDFDPFAPDLNDKPGNSDKNTVTYTVTVVDQNGAPVADIPVQLCDGDLCITPLATDANGVSVFNIKPANYSVKIPLPEHQDQLYYFDGDSTELTVTITKNAD